MTRNRIVLPALLVLTFGSASLVAQGAPQRKNSNTAAKEDLPVIDINKAGVDDFDRLPGIGPALARQIVAYRVKHGPFRRAEDLLAVPRIGHKKWRRMRPYLKVGDDEGIDDCQSRELKVGNTK